MLFLQQNIFTAYEPVGLQDSTLALSAGERIEVRADFVDRHPY
ncbi:MAG: hypothetical protein AB8G15_16480 [Saprospiraceae bacterium]